MQDILSLLSHAKIKHKGLFLNADSGFDSEYLRKLLEKEEIMGNIKVNRRSSKTTYNDYYFDDELYKKQIQNREGKCLVRRLQGIAHKV